MVFKMINSNFYGKLWIFFLCYLLVTSRSLVVTSGYLVDTSGYLIAISVVVTSGYVWLLLVTLVPRFTNNEHLSCHQLLVSNILQ